MWQPLSKWLTQGIWIVPGGTMNDQRNYYEVMDLDVSATLPEIKRRYRELVRKFHPDLNTDKTFTLRAFVQINKAYRTLSDAERRQLYDASLVVERRVVESEAEIGRKVRDADNAIMRGDAKFARTTCEEVLKSAPENVEALRILGDVLSQLGEFDGAVAAYRRANALAPSFVIAAKIGRLEARVPKKGEAPKKDTPPKKEASLKKGGRTKEEPKTGPHRHWLFGSKKTSV